MRKPWLSMVRSIALFTAAGSLLAAPARGAVVPVPDREEARVRAEAAAAESAERSRLAEAILDARISAGSRMPDPSFRAQWREQLLHVPSEQLSTFRDGGAGGNLYTLTSTRSAAVPPSPALLGDSSADLAYTPVTPCRIIDTRTATRPDLAGSPLHPGTAYPFLAAWSTYAGQGGLAGSCGVPFGPSTTVLVNFASTQSAGAGNLREWAWSDPATAAPRAVVLNYGNLAALGMTAIDNAVAVPICDLATGSSCDSDLFLQVFGNDTHVVADIVGYFRKIDMPMRHVYLSPQDTSVAGWIYAFEPTDFTPSRNMSCVLTVNGVATNLGTPVPSTGLVRLWGAYKASGAVNLVSGSATVLRPPYLDGDSSFTMTFPVTGGSTYRFGAALQLSGSYLSGTALDSLSQATYFCR